MPEVIDDGITGHAVDDMDEAVDMLESVLALDRRQVRQRFEERFSAARMAQDYVQLYERQIGAVGPRTLQSLPLRPSTTALARTSRDSRLPPRLWPTQCALACGRHSCFVMCVAGSRNARNRPGAYRRPQAHSERI